MSLRARGPGVLLLAASAALLCVAIADDGQVTPPIQARLNGWPTLSVRQSFEVSRPASYRASIEVDRKHTFARTACLLGVSNGDIEADNGCDLPRPQIKVEIAAGGRNIEPVQVFPAGITGVNDRIALDVAVYELRPGIAYVAESRLIGASSELKATNPRFVLGLDPMEVKDGLGRRALSVLGSLILALGAGRLLWRTGRRSRPSA